MPKDVKHVNSLSFTSAVIGANLSRDKDGGFGPGTGTWTAIKLFLPGQNDEQAEVFLNISPATKKAEFSIKDSDYGDDILKDLASIL